MAEQATHDQHAEAHESHSTRFYWMVGAILAVITAVEVAIFVYKDMVGNELFLAILFLLSIGKAAGVLMYFMHLRGDARVFQLVFIIPFTLAVTLCLGFLTIFSEHVGIAG